MRFVVVVGHVVHLHPFVGSHDHDVEALGNIGDELVFGAGDHEPVRRCGVGFKSRNSFVETWSGRIRFVERCHADDQMDFAEVVTLTGQTGDFEVCNGQRIERARKRSASEIGSYHTAMLP